MYPSQVQMGGIPATSDGGGTPLWVPPMGPGPGGTPARSRQGGTPARSDRGYPPWGLAGGTLMGGTLPRVPRQTWYPDRGYPTSSTPPSDLAGGYPISGTSLGLARRYPDRGGVGVPHLRFPSISTPHRTA